MSNPFTIKGTTRGSLEIRDSECFASKGSQQALDLKSALLHGKSTNIIYVYATIKMKKKTIQRKAYVSNREIPGFWNNKQSC